MGLGIKCLFILFLDLSQDYQQLAVINIEKGWADIKSRIPTL